MFEVVQVPINKVSSLKPRPLIINAALRSADNTVMMEDFLAFIHCLSVHPLQISIPR